MKQKCILTKGDERIEFDSISSAGRFLGLKGHGLSHYYIEKGECRGWAIEIGEQSWGEIDITGEKYGRLVPVERLIRHNPTKIVWKCKCECGNYTYATSSDLKKGRRISCGCARAAHGMSRTRLYVIWKDMKQRCNYRAMPCYKNYGGRGIKVCPEWQRFKPFMEWAKENGYQDDLTLDRIDNDKGYSPDNCRWISVREQCLNKRTNNYIICDGVALPLCEWAKKSGLSPNTIRERLKKGWTAEEAMRSAVRTAKKPIIAKNLKTGERRRYESSVDATKDGFSRPSIWRCITGEYSHHHGWTFEYEKEIRQ